MSVTVYIDMFVAEWMLFFFNVFINHFPKIHRSALRKITVDCCIFETFMAIIYEEKISGEVVFLFIQNKCLYVSSLFQGKETPAQLFSCGCCFWKHNILCKEKLLRA